MPALEGKETDSSPRANVAAAAGLRALVCTPGARSCRQLQNIRLSSDVANPLSRSQNCQADGDGCVGLHLMQVSRRGSRV
jgi:hypothetical protein